MIQGTTDYSSLKHKPILPHEKVSIFALSRLQKYVTKFTNLDVFCSNLYYIQPAFQLCWVSGGDLHNEHKQIYYTLLNKITVSLHLAWPLQKEHFSSIVTRRAISSLCYVKANIACAMWEHFTTLGLSKSALFVLKGDFCSASVKKRNCRPSFPGRGHIPAVVQIGKYITNNTWINKYYKIRVNSCISLITLELHLLIFLFLDTETVKFAVQSIIFYW